MAYTGYSEYTPVFTKLIVNEFVNDYEGDSYIGYYENIRLYLQGAIDEEMFVKFLENSNFCIYELDHLLENVNNLLENNIPYKQKLNKFISDNIDSRDVNNKMISVKALSLLFDDFIENYSYDIFDYECFYISIFGIFINLDDSGFMEFMNGIIKKNSLTFEDFYFLINFMKELVDYTCISKYSREFIIYSEDFLDVVDDSLEHISILMFMTFKINKILQDICNNQQDNVYLKDKKFVLVILKLFSIYCNEYNVIFIDQIDDKNKKFIENTNIMYVFLKALAEFPINKEDCLVILNVYSKLIFDYVEYESMKKITNVVKYLVSPVLKQSDLNEEINKKNVVGGEQEIINMLSFCFLMKYDYVKKFTDKYRSFDYEFDNQICFYILKLIVSEDIEMKKKRFSDFIENYYVRLLEGINSKEDGLFSYLLWITSDIVKNDIAFKGISKIYPLLTISNRISDQRLYDFIKKVIDGLEGGYLYSFEGKSFYNTILDSEKKFYQSRIDREYFYAKYFFEDEHSEDIEIEKNKFINSLVEYFKNSSLNNREKYYRNLLNNKYFDVYKFDILNELNKLNIDENLVKNECDFLIYNSPHEEGLKFGITLSLYLKEYFYEEVYYNILNKVNWGDIFYLINDKFGYKSSKIKTFINHNSFIFLIKYEFYRVDLLNLIESNKNKQSEIKKIKHGLLEDIINTYSNEFKENLNSYDLVYIIISHYYFENDVKDIDMLTLKLKTIVKMINEDKYMHLLNDNYIYRIFEKCFEAYTKYFISFTQFEVLEEIYTALEKKFINTDISYKEIESNNDLNENLEENFKSKSSDVLKNINRKLKSSEAEDYFENIFASENIDLIIKILSNETKFYNETLKFFYEYLKHMNLGTIENIYKKCLQNIFVAKVFIKILSNYPDVLLNTLTDYKKSKVYLKIVNCSF